MNNKDRIVRVLANWLNEKAALNLNGAVRLCELMCKHPIWVFFSRFGVPRNVLAVFLAMHCALWVTPSLAAEAEDASKADVLNRQVVELYQAGKYQEAVPIARQLLEIHQGLSGPQHRDTAASLNNLAMLYQAMGDYAKAEPLYQRALTILEKALGPQHPSTATSLSNLAELYRVMGDYARAELLLRRALWDQGKALGPEHPYTATSLKRLAFLNLDLGKADGALELAVRAKKSQETQLGNILSFTSEQQRLAFQEKTNPFGLVATLGSAPDIAQAILHDKGVVLDSLLEDRLVAEASNDPKQREVIDQIRAAKQRFTQLLMEIPKDFSAGLASSGKPNWRSELHKLNSLKLRWPVK